jgi:hypothetical protein
MSSGGYQRPVPSFDGYYIFGVDVVMVTIDPPREKQVNAFLGINGVESIDLGMRMRHTQVTGRFIADNEYDLGNIESAFRAYKNPGAYELVTTDGIAWPAVQLDSFEPVPPIGYDRASGMVWRRYRARFNHLGDPQSTGGG